MYQSFKFRIYPDKEQLSFINKSFGCTRFIYNYYLSKIKDQGYPNAYSNISDYTSDLNASINIMYEGIKLYMKEVLI